MSMFKIEFFTLFYHCFKLHSFPDNTIYLFNRKNDLFCCVIYAENYIDEIVNEELFWIL